jgi:hypothetical protein
MLDGLYEFLEKFWNQIISVFEWIIDSLIYSIGMIFYFLLDFVLNSIEFIVNSIDFANTGLFNIFDSWGVLPDQVLWILNYLNFMQMLTYLFTAYLIRMTLNLIPFVRI